MSNLTEDHVKTVALTILTANPSLGAEGAESLAKAVLAVPIPVATPTPAAGPPPMPMIDHATLANVTPAQRAAAWIQHERDLAAWVPVRQSYIEPITESAQAAKVKLQELRQLSEASTDAEKATRAMERERLMTIVLTGGAA